VINDDPLLGVGMAAAEKNALDEAGIAMHQVSFRMSDVGGESYAFEELALEQSRLMLQTRKCQDLWCPAGFIGDCGAAAGTIFRRPVTPAEHTQIVADWDYVRKEYQAIEGIPSVGTVTTTLTAELGRAPTQKETQDERQVNHLTPKSAGGCPTGDGNLAKNGSLCSVCRGFEDRFTKLQDLIAKMP